MTKRARETFSGPLGTVIGGTELADDDPRVTATPTEFDDAAAAGGSVTEIGYDTDSEPYLK
jgi:hypothetical protein